MIPQRRHLAALVIVLSLLSVAKQCPSREKDLDRMAKASNEIANDALTANRVVAEFYTAGKLSLEAKDKAANLIGQIHDKGVAFNNLLIEMDARYRQGTVPSDVLQILRENFAEVAALIRELASGLTPFAARDVTKNLTKRVETIEGVLK